MAKEPFKPGRRYGIEFAKAEAVRPYLNGEMLDLSRGTRCINSILWRCWTTSGRTVDIAITSQAQILSVTLSDEPDPELPPVRR